MHSNEKILYHGSPNGIVGDIRSKSEDNCDFGCGFYLATDRDYAACNALQLGKNGRGYVYTVGADYSGLKVYTFEDMLFWMLYTAYNRGSITDIHQYKELWAMISELQEYDVIVGPIADDRSAYAFQRFLDNGMTDECLIKCISHFELGFQYVFKNDTACKHLSIIEEKILEGEEYDEVMHDKRVRIGTSVEIVREYESKYRRTGLYFDELLEKYR